MPGVDAVGANARGEEVHVRVICGEARRVPGDIDRRGIRDGLGSGRGFVETASAAG